LILQSMELPCRTAGPDSQARSASCSVRAYQMRKYAYLIAYKMRKFEYQMLTRCVGTHLSYQMRWYASIYLVCIWYASGTHLVRIWYASGTHLVRIWYASGTHLVRIWYASGTHLVRIWYASGTHVCKMCNNLFLIWYAQSNLPTLLDKDSTAHWSQS
jgi:hypothetical protein